MPKFQLKQSKKTTEISTASLPDIIFMLLFFFMVVTVMRNQDIMVKMELPTASEVQQLGHPSNIEHIYIGTPINEIYGERPLIQVNDAFAEIKDIESFLRSHTKDNQIISLEVDRSTTMGVLDDVKTAIRKSDRLNVNYAAMRE